MSQTQRERAAEGHRRALRAFAGGKECAVAYIRFVQKREAVLEKAKSHGLKKGVAEYEQCLQKLQLHCHRLSATFRLDGYNAVDGISSGSDKQRSSREQGNQMANAAASTPNTAAGPSNAQQQAVAASPNPPPPPLPGLPFHAKPGAAKAAANVAKGPTLPQAPPPPPPLPPTHVAAGLQQHQQGQKACTSSSTAAGTPAAARPSPPPPPPPLPSSFGKANGLPAAAAEGPAVGAVARPPPPPPGPPPSAAALQGTAAAAAGGASAAGSSGATASQPKATGVCTAPPPPPLPKKLRPLATASEGVKGLAAVAAAAAAAAAASNSHGSNSPGAEQEGLPPLSSSSSVASAGGKLKTLHVDPVPVHRLAHGSFWTVADPVAKPFKDSMEYLLRTMFSDVPRSTHKHHHHSPRNSNPGTPGVDSVATDGSAEAIECEVVTCVPEKRALHVEVVLKRLHVSAEALAVAINQLNTDKLKPDDLAAIRSILPKPEELQAVREAMQTAEKKAAAVSPRTLPGASTPVGSGTAHSSEGCATPGVLSPRLGVVEAAFDALGSVELLQAKMRAMEFRYDVESVASLVSEYARDIGHSLDVLRVSGQLQYLLAFVRDVANTMNQAGPKGPLAGFKLESLARLQTTKMAGATDLNLLHYIVAHMSAVLPGVLVLDAEREAFRSACRRGTFDSVTVRIRTLLDTQKRLLADLAAAQKMQQHRRSQQESATGETAGSCSSSVAGGAATDGSTTPRCCSNGSSSESHDIYVARLTELLDNAGPKVDALQQQLDDIITKFKWTAEYYCEDVKGQAWKQQPVAFLTHFLELLDSLATTQKDTARLARVTSMLAEYVAAQQMWQQRQVLLKQRFEQQALHDQAQLNAEDPQRQHQGHQMLLQQQELLRQHLEASERLHKSGGSSPSLASEVLKGSNQPDDDEEQEQQHGFDDSDASSVNSSAESTQLYDADDAAHQQQPQQKPSCVPRLDLGGSAKTKPTIAADATFYAEHSWGSEDSAEYGGNSITPAGEAAVVVSQQVQDTHQQVLGLPSCPKPMQQAAHADGAEAHSVQDLHDVEELQLSLASDEKHSTDLALVTATAVTASWAPRRSVVVQSVGVSNDERSSAAPDAAGQLAAEAAAVARRRAGAMTLSRSLDSSVFPAVHGWPDTEESAAAAAAGQARTQSPVSAGNGAKTSASSSTPVSCRKVQPHQHQQLGLWQPCRSTGQKSNRSSQQPQRGRLCVVSPGALHKRPRQETLVREAAAVAAMHQIRPKSASPTPSKLSVQQQRLEALRLRGKRANPEQQQQQQEQHQADGQEGGLEYSIVEAQDGREKLARLLQSSIGSQM